MAAAEDFQARQLSFWTCVNMVANAVGRCEVKTFRGREEIQEQEYYLWNVEPNVNQNSSAFWHKLIAKLFLDNEALVISSKRRDGMDVVMVADSWQQSTFWPMRMNEYINVTVGDTAYEKPSGKRGTAFKAPPQRHAPGGGRSVPVLHAAGGSGYEPLSVGAWAALEGPC